MRHKIHLYISITVLHYDGFQFTEQHLNRKETELFILYFLCIEIELKSTAWWSISPLMRIFLWVIVVSTWVMSDPGWPHKLFYPIFDIFTEDIPTPSGMSTAPFWNWNGVSAKMSETSRSWVPKRSLDTGNKCKTFVWHRGGIIFILLLLALAWTVLWWKMKSVWIVGE